MILLEESISQTDDSLSLETEHSRWKYTRLCKAVPGTATLTHRPFSQSQLSGQYIRLQKKSK